ncbi:MAG TPA: hypothetical protein VM487_01925 [Phycisphaerae bacterium]|nr:hypothetical protein [Phycisphaerae bacterium]
MDAKRRTNLGWNAWVLLTFVGGVMLMAGCGADPEPGSAGNNPLDLLGVTAGAADAKAPAQEQTDPEDGDTQTGEFEGEHQFGANDGAEDDTDDDVEDDDQQGEFEGEHQHGDDGDEDGENNEDEQEAEGNELKAILSGGGVTVIVEYEQEADDTSFEVEVTGGQPEATLDVAVNDIVVLSITLNSTGGGEFEFSSAPDDADEQQLPAEFPILSAGDIVAVGDLSGPLEVEQED